MEIILSTGEYDYGKNTKENIRSGQRRASDHGELQVGGYLHQARACFQRSTRKKKIRRCEFCYETTSSKLLRQSFFFRRSLDRKGFFTVMYSLMGTLRFSSLFFRKKLLSSSAHSSFITPGMTSSMV